MIKQTMLAFASPCYAGFCFAYPSSLGEAPDQIGFAQHHGIAGKLAYGQGLRVQDEEVRAAAETMSQR